MMSLSLPQQSWSQEFYGKGFCGDDKLNPTKIRKQMTLNQLCDFVKSKLVGGQYHSIQYAFKMFSAQGNSSVTLCALYRILCNYVPGLDLHNFNLLMKKIQLDRNKLVSFHEFYSKFQAPSDDKKGWQYPFVRCRKSHTWQFVHSELTEKAQNGLASFCSSLHCNKQGVIAKTQFKKFLIDSSFNLDEDQFEHLWKKYDPDGNGWLTVRSLLQHLAVGTDAQPTGSLVKSVDDTMTKLIEHLRKLDTLKCGKLNAAQLCTALSQVGLNLTVVQVEELLLRLGLPAKGAIDYCKFIDYFVCRSEGSPVHLMLTQSRKAQQKGSTEGAENSLVSLLQSKFLKLVASLRLYDARNSGYVEKEDFRRCVRNLLPGEDTTSLEDVIATLCDDPHSPLPKVPYPRFLAMFGGTKGSRHRQRQDVSPSRPLGSLSPYRPFSKVVGTVDPKLLEQLTHLVAHDLPCLTSTFVELDDQNTGRLTLEQTLDLLLRCGIVTTKSQLSLLWQRLLKNRDGTVDFQQFIKEFTKGSVQSGGLTETCGLVGPRPLPRVVDRILEKLRHRFRNCHDLLLKHFRAVDISRSGCISLHTFQQTVRKLCPAITDSELNAVMSKYPVGQSALVNYEKMLSFFSPRVTGSRTGNNTSSILSHQEQEAAQKPFTALPLATKPNHGLPGTKGYLQKKLTGKWKELRRMFKNLDSSGSGFVSVSEFKRVLQHCNIRLTSEQYYHVLEALDPYLSGLINYRTFINSIFD